MAFPHFFGALVLKVDARVGQTSTCVHLAWTAACQHSKMQILCVYNVQQLARVVARKTKYD